MQMAIFRAIENRSWIARCANSGFTLTVDPYGRKYGTSELEVRDIVYGEIGKVDSRTFFTKHGLWLPQACLVATFLFLFAGLVVKLIRK
jgi:apolipoprotein N-acyltransferase